VPALDPDGLPADEGGVEHVDLTGDSSERRLVELFWGSTLSLSLLSGTTPRSLLDRMFRIAPSDEQWRSVEQQRARDVLERFLGESGGANASAADAA
jgi:hypothetical protein